LKLLSSFLLGAVLLAPSIALSDAQSRLTGGLAPGELRLADTESPTARKTYIVQLEAPPAAEHVATRSRSAHRRAGHGPANRPRQRFDKSSAAVKSYTAQLQEQQEQVISRAGGNIDKIYSYVYGLNGFAARMSAADAHKLEHRPEVKAVWEDEIRPMATSHSASFLELYDATNGLRGAAGLTGAGIVIGIIDSGVYPEHPALKDTKEADRPRLCQGSWADSSLLGRWLCRRYRRAPDQVLFEEPEDWNGSCQTGTRFAETDCNNKLIGARWFVDGAQSSGLIDPGEVLSARDVDGHGTHTATTAAGNRTDASIFGTSVGRVEGMASGARIAVYKACWLRPGDQRASCNTSDLAMAIDAAVADGVDVINYSVGSSMLQISAPDDLSMMAAAKAGVVSVVAAGNEGPNLGTIGSPAGGPWVITAAAASRDGQFSVEAMQVLSPPSIATKYAVKEANFTPPLADNDPIENTLVLVDDDDDSGGDGTTSDACEPLINGDEIDGKIAFIQRGGGCGFDTKISNAEDAGAIAVLVYSIAGDAIIMGGSSALVNIPALMIGQADGNLIISEMDAGNAIEVVLDKGLLLTESETGNIMASFSGRGPGPVNDIMKPDVTAPGVNILAGFTADAVNATPNETFAYLSGTSMATPHVAGIAALLLEAHPEWSPAAVKSALMTSSRQDLIQSDGEGQAHPFEFGAGHIVPNGANDPGLVYDLDNEDYDAFACGFALDSVTTERCEALEAAGMSFDPADMNQPSIAIGRLASSRTVSRTVTNVSDQAASYTASIAAPVGMQVGVNPPSLSLVPGESASFDVTVTYVSGPLDLWRFGSLTWESGEHSVRSTIAVKPVSLDAPGEITSFGGTGSAEFDVEFGYTGAYTPQVHGLRLPRIDRDLHVDNDPTKTFSFRNGAGVTQIAISVPADQLYLRFALFDSLTDGDDDLDMYVYYCGLNNTSCVKIGESGGPTSQERFDLFRPAGGVYGILIHGFKTDEVAGGPGAVFTMLSWAFGEIDDRNNMTVSGPGTVNAGSTETITVNWTNLLSDTIYLGGISHNTPEGLAGVTLITIGN
jgi:subtilisin family serine protease